MQTYERQEVEAADGSRVVTQKRRHVRGQAVDRFCAGQRIAMKDSGRFKETHKRTKVCLMCAQLCLGIWPTGLLL
jgi:Pyruvate/2-oxoacid:ferredoxin oxidoreductase delta subunit